MQINPIVQSAIWDFRALLLFFMLASAAIFVYGFSVNQSRSITTERNRFLFYQNAALSAAKVDDEAFLILLRAENEIVPLSTISTSVVRRSVVWTMKLVSTTFFITGAWTTAMLLALDKRSVADILCPCTIAGFERITLGYVDHTDNTFLYESSSRGAIVMTRGASPLNQNLYRLIQRALH